MLRAIQTIEDVEEFNRWLSEQPFITLDTETTGHSLYHPDFAVRTVQIGSRNAAWIIELERWIGLVADILRRFQGPVVIHNFGYDVPALARYGITVSLTRVEDTFIALRLAEPDQPAGLKEAGERHISKAASEPQADMFRAMKANKWDWATIPLEYEGFRRYAGLDPVLTARLYEHPVVKRGMRSPVYDLEMQVRAICNRIQANGLRVDEDHCTKIQHAYAFESEQIKAAISDDFGFSVTSNDELADHLLSTDARAAMTKATPGGKPSVDREVLEAVVAAGYPDDAWVVVAEAALRVRKLDKYRASYLEHFLEPSIDGMVHAGIDSLAARTGRMSVREPPLHQLPAPDTSDPESYDIRKCIVPRADDEILMVADYDQIELRTAGNDSGDEGLVGAFREADETGIDFFTTSAQSIYDDPELVKADPRRAPIKTFWYSALYGASVKRQARAAGVSTVHMKAVAEAIARAYPKFWRLMARCEATARENGGWIETPAGRRLRVPEDKLFVATNYRIQGWAADVMKQATVAMAQAGLEDLMVMLVHDEVVLSVPDKDAREVAYLVQTSMENYDHPIPLTTGPPLRVSNWAEAK